MNEMQLGLIQKDHFPDSIETGVTRHALFHHLPKSRTVSDVLKRASLLEKQLPDRVLPFEEDWDLVILAREIKRLRDMIDV